MTASTIVDYKNIYFQVPDLTKMHWEPIYPQLQILLNQIKANTLLLQWDLSGGLHGHIGLIFGLEDYEKVSLGTPYERPLMPAPLRIPSNTKTHKTQRLQALFKGTRQLYRETVDVEKEITKQIVSAIDKITSSNI